MPSAIDPTVRALVRAVCAVAVAVGVLAACGGSEPKGKTPSGARASCSADSECALTDTSGCCKACKEEPLALPILAFEQQTHRCRSVECPPPDERIECPAVSAVSAYVAVCSDGTCAARKR